MPKPVVAWRALAAWLVAGLPTTALAEPLLAIDAARVTSLAGSWAFRGGDDPRWAAPSFEDGDWSRRPLRPGFDRA